MFFKQEIKKIQDAKNRLAICCDLRRQLVQIEVYGIWSGVFNTGSNLALGFAVIEQILGFLHERKGKNN